MKLSSTQFETRYCQELWDKYMGIGGHIGEDEDIPYKEYVEVQYDVYSYLISVGREYQI